MFTGILIAVVLVVAAIALSGFILKRFFEARNVDVEHLERGPMISQKIPEPGNTLVEGHSWTE